MPPQVLADALQREETQPTDTPNTDALNAAGPVTLDKMLAGRTGRINSGGSQLARNAEKEFGGYLDEKRRQGKL